VRADDFPVDANFRIVLSLALFKHLHALLKCQIGAFILYVICVPQAGDPAGFDEKNSQVFGEFERLFGINPDEAACHDVSFLAEMSEVAGRR
jgi:hypothetical protein